MAKRRPKIAFMMFQDVIMAVFGMLILIVVYLLLNAKVSDIEFIEALNQLEEHKADLGDAVSDSEQQLQELQAANQRQMQQRRNADTQQQWEANAEQIAKLEQQITDAVLQVDEATEALTATVDGRFAEHPEILATRKELVESKEKLTELADELQSKQSSIEEQNALVARTESYLEQIRQERRIEIDDSFANKSVYLIDLGAREIEGVQVFKGEEKRVSVGSVKSLIQQVSSDSEQKHVFVFVRPDGIVNFKQLKAAMRELRIPLGYQPMAYGEELVLTQFPEGDELPQLPRGEEGASDASEGELTVEDGGASVDVLVGDGSTGSDGSVGASDSSEGLAEDLTGIGERSASNDSELDSEQSSEPIAEEIPEAGDPDPEEIDTWMHYKWLAIVLGAIASIMLIRRLIR